MSEKKDVLAKPSSQGALRRLLMVLLFTVGMLIYSYGWTVTDIDLTLPQEQRRQDNVTRALRELLSPRIFDQARELATLEAPILMDCSTGDAPSQASGNDDGTPYIVLEPACASQDEIITVHLYNAAPNADARIRWQPPLVEGTEVNARPMTVIETGREELVVADDGSFTGTIEVPRIRAGAGQIHTVQILIAVPSGPIIFSDTANQVIARMAETIFMALVATTVAIPIAVLISFFAAQNLMKRMGLSVGTMLLAVVVFSLGAWLGASYLMTLGEWGLSVGKGELWQPIGAVVAFLIPIGILFLTVFALRYLARLDGKKDKRDTRGNPILQASSNFIVTIVLVFIVGAIGGLAILSGQGITGFADNILRPAAVTEVFTWSQNAFADLIWAVGNLLLILGTLLELFISPITAVIVGAGLAIVVSTLFGDTVRRLRAMPSHLLGGILGAISGAIVMAVAANFGLWAALLGLLPLIIGGILGGTLALQVFGRVMPRQTIDGVYIRSNGEQILRNVVFAIGALAVAFFLFNSLNMNRSFVDGTLPAQTLVPFLGLELTAYMFTTIWVGALLGGLSGGLAGAHGVFPLGSTLYNFARITLNLVRSIEPLIMGLVFVIWVGIGPFAGVLALTLHSIASLGKLYSEQIENIDPGPIEALESTGANQLQTIIYAVVPQIVPPYIAFTMYRWDINVRMSTIIGFVGGGGIGLLLQQQINLLRYRDAGVAVLAIAVVVSILDYASAKIRESIG